MNYDYTFEQEYKDDKRKESFLFFSLGIVQVPYYNNSYGYRTYRFPRTYRGDRMVIEFTEYLREKGRGYELNYIFCPEWEQQVADTGPLPPKPEKRSLFSRIAGLFKREKEVPLQTTRKI